jgi:hypothetical protein
VWLAGIPGVRETRPTPSKETCRLRVVIPRGATTHKYLKNMLICKWPKNVPDPGQARYVITGLLDPDPCQNYESADPDP